MNPRAPPILSMLMMVLMMMKLAAMVMIAR
jgi:hypothetical protein